MTRDFAKQTTPRRVDTIGTIGTMGTIGSTEGWIGTIDTIGTMGTIDSTEGWIGAIDTIDSTRGCWARWPQRAIDAAVRKKAQEDTIARVAKAKSGELKHEPKKQ
jgi:hypothetical protein